MKNNETRKREDILIQLKNKYTNIEELNNQVFEEFFFNKLKEFCFSTRNYELSSTIQQIIKRNPFQQQLTYFTKVHDQKIIKRETKIQYFQEKLILLLKQNRVVPKILTSIKVKDNQIKLKNRNPPLLDDIHKAQENEEYLVDEVKLDYQEKDFEDLPIDQLILLSLKKLEQNIEKYCNPNFLCYQDVLQIKDIYNKMGSIDFKSNQYYEEIYIIYGKFVNKLNQIVTGFDNEDFFRVVGPLKNIILRKIGKIVLSELVKNQIALPKILTQISLLQANEQSKFVQKKAFELRFTHDFLDQILTMPEIKEFIEIFNFPYLQRCTTWRAIKTYYFQVIATNFREQENQTENEILSFQLQEIYDNINQYSEELKKLSRFGTVAKMFLQVEQRLNYLLDKQVIIDDCDDETKEFLLIAYQLLKIRSVIYAKFNKQNGEIILEEPIKKKKSYQKREIKLKKDLDKINQKYRTMTLMLANQRRKISYLLKYFIQTLNSGNQPYPFILGIMEWKRFNIRATINQQSLDFLVTDTVFMKFMHDEYKIDISFGTNQERIDKIINEPYSDYVKKTDSQTLGSWTQLLAKQARLVNEQKELISLQIRKILSNNSFNKEVDNLIQSGQTSTSYSQLISDLIKIREFVNQLQ
ncbi:unnamed protein product [Paramecium sonneborni]|uniref:Uncharacterized protein n=1 Tax=Paramecium sonneborni TaxID=65129 RepID=A0A8S1KTC9_9CILI|nr:unnamed protein product [Paramecium sonneborni]